MRFGRNRLVATLLCLCVASVILVVVPASAGASGGVRAWGRNNVGQVGDGTTTARPSPVALTLIANAESLAANGAHSLALRGDGRVYGWGDNGHGEVGNGSSVAVTAPAPVSGLDDATAIAAGKFHSVALRDDGSVWAWGYNGHGELGNGASGNASTPARALIDGVAAIGAGSYHTLAVRDDGAVWAWGRSDQGQAGNAAPSNIVPLRVAGVDGVEAVAGGGAHSLALGEDGTVWSWGDNTYGQLGDRVGTGPARVPALGGVRAIAAGTAHSLALLADGTVRAWGQNASGQLGTAETTASATPVTPSGLTDVVAIAASDASSLALRADGSVWRWGRHLTDGGRTTTPAPVAGLEGISAIALGETHALAIEPLRLTIDSGPAGSVRSASAEFRFSASVAADFACALDGDDPEPCGSPMRYDGLFDGSHTFWVQAADESGNTSIPQVRTWIVDTVAPSISITDEPAEIVATTTATFAFESADPEATFGCSLDLGTFASCTSPKTYTGLSHGTHTFTARAIDPAGNTTDVTRSWTIDTSAPTPTITAGPSGSLANTSARFAFSADRPATFTCSLDGAPGSACSSPLDYVSLGQGAHTFSLIASNDAGVSSAPIVRTWTVDTRPPALSIDGGPAGTGTSPSATFTFSANESVTFTCKLDGEPGVACTSPTTYAELGNGPHAFALTATDAAGNRSPLVTRTWSIDAPAPSIAIHSGPSGTVASLSAEFTFGSSDASARFACSIDGQAFASCSSPATFFGLREGPRTFGVRAIGSDGATSVAATRAWTIDVTPPSVAAVTPRHSAIYFDNVLVGNGTGNAIIVSSGAPFTLRANAQDATAVTVVFAVDSELLCEDATPAYSCAWVPEPGEHTITLTPIDAAGNIGEPVTSRVLVL